MKLRSSQIQICAALTAAFLAALGLRISRSLSTPVANETDPAITAPQPILPTVRARPADNKAWPRPSDSNRPLVEASAEPEWITDQVEGGSESVPRNALAARWVGVSFEGLLDRLQTTTTQGPMWAAQEVEYWLVAHPDDGPAAVLQTLQSTTPADWVFSGLLVAGLAQADNAPARQALASVLASTDVYPPAALIQAAMAAGAFGATADEVLKAQLLQLVDSPLTDGEHQLSEVALSSLARLAQDDVATQQLLRERLSPWLESTASPQAMAQALDALTTAGVNQPDLIARAEQLANSPDEAVKVAAQKYLSERSTWTAAVE